MKYEACICCLSCKMLRDNNHVNIQTLIRVYVVQFLFIIQNQSCISVHFYFILFYSILFNFFFSEHTYIRANYILSQRTLGNPVETLLGKPHFHLRRLWESLEHCSETYKFRPCKGRGVVSQKLSIGCIVYTYKTIDAHNSQEFPNVSGNVSSYNLGKYLFAT